MRIHYLQHVSFEGPGAITEWARQRGHELRATRLDLGETPPGIEAFDWLVVMGGPMGIADRVRYPWMEAELELIRRAFEAGRRVLGICLGAQFLAHALGARVYPADEGEIGWFSVEAVPAEGRGAFDGFPATFTPLHWHGDTFDLPTGAIHLARGPSCTHQAFQIGPRALGLQFHIEAMPTSVAELVSHCEDEIGTGRWHMAAADIRDCHARCAAVRPILDQALDFLDGAP